MSRCYLCPVECGADRDHERGVCGCTNQVYVAKIMLHKWEEPCISSTDAGGSGADAVVSSADAGGSGAVFFCGCPLGCVFCQNREISRYEGGFAPGAREFSVSELSEAFLSLQKSGAYNINLVSPTQYTPQIIAALSDARQRGLVLPVVWNTGGYEKAETISALKGHVDVFLTDLKYKSSHLSGELSRAPDYFPRAMSALHEMVRVAGKPRYNGDGLMVGGVILRHLVLPGCRQDSIDTLRSVAEAGLSGKVVLSLMSQYTPDFFTGCADGRLDRALRRRITTFEYEKVVDEALRLGFDGYIQERSAAVCDYTPTWGIE